MSSVSVKKLAPSKRRSIWHVKDPCGSGGLNASLSASRLQLAPRMARVIKAERVTTATVED
jgi:hypothetical protein